MIELLVVIAIIGILSSVILASLNTARQKARDARRLADVKQLQIALELYNDANGQYPTAIDNPHLVTPGHIQVIPIDPSTNAAYLYAGLGSGAKCTSYHLGTTLEAPNNALNSSADLAAGLNCNGSADDFSSTKTDLIYDVKP